MKNRKNPIAKNMPSFNKPKIIPNKKGKKVLKVLSKEIKESQDDSI